MKNVRMDACDQFVSKLKLILSVGNGITTVIKEVILASLFIIYKQFPHGKQE